MGCNVLEYPNFLQSPEDYDHLAPWDPNLIVMNIDGQFALDRKTNDILFDHPNCEFPLVKQLWRFKGTFKENLELEHFPVDVQVIETALFTR